MQCERETAYFITDIFVAKYSFFKIYLQFFFSILSNFFTMFFSKIVSKILFQNFFHFFSKFLFQNFYPKFLFQNFFSSETPFFSKLYFTIIFNVNVRQLIKNSPLRTHHYMHIRMQPFQLKSGEKYRMLHGRKIVYFPSL